MTNFSAAEKAFINKYKRRVFARISSEENPEFIYIIGAKGAGKTTLARKLENTVLVSADDIVGNLVKDMGWNADNYGDDPKNRLFLAQVANELFKEAINNRYSIAFDTGLTDNTEKLVNIMNGKGYDIKFKAILADDIMAQLNVASRKLDYDEKFARYKEGKGDFPEGENPIEVDLRLASKSAIDTVSFLQKLYAEGYDFEVYEYGKQKPSYDTREAKNSFDDYLEDFCSRLPAEETYRQRLENLQKRADKSKCVKIKQGLNSLYAQLFGGR